MVTKRKSRKAEKLKELDFLAVLGSGKLYPSRFQGTSRRLKILSKIGHSCVSCGRGASRLTKFRESLGNRTFWSILSEDGVEITIDHIKPKSMGGKDTLENYQPMCSLCNYEKGNGLKLVRYLDIKNKEDLVGKDLWMKGRKKFIYKGTFERVGVNPHTNTEEIFIASERGSSYKICDRVYLDYPRPTKGG